MANLTYRAERALLGALLHDPDLLDDLGVLTADDFASEQHAEVFRGIRTAYATNSGRGYEPFELAVVANAEGPGLSTRYLQSLTDACPNPMNAPAYARMVMEAGLSRQILAHAERLFRDAGDLYYEAHRVGSSFGAEQSTEPFPVHLLKLALAMRAHARRFDPAEEADQESDQPGRDEDQVRRQQEEEVLADLLQHPSFDSPVLEWLSAAAFTEGPRREIYEAITVLIRRGDPVDELTVDWQLANDRALKQPPRLPEEGAAAAGDESGYVSLLAATPVVSSAATLTGQALLLRHASAQIGAIAAEPQEPKETHAMPQPPAIAPPHSRPSELLEPPPGAAPHHGPQPRL